MAREIKWEEGHGELQPEPEFKSAEVEKALNAIIDSLDDMSLDDMSFEAQLAAFDDSDWAYRARPMTGPELGWWIGWPLMPFLGGLIADIAVTKGLIGSNILLYLAAVLAGVLVHLAVHWKFARRVRKPWSWKRCPVCGGRTMSLAPDQMMRTCMRCMTIIRTDKSFEENMAMIKLPYLGGLK